MDAATVNNIITRMLHDFEQLKKDVSSANVRHLGDVYQLQRQIDNCVTFTSQYSQFIAMLQPSDRTTIMQSVALMIENLNVTKAKSIDVPDSQPGSIVHLERTGKRGRPKIVVDQPVLAQALQFRGPTALADVFGCSPRTVRRRALEAGLVQPGSPVYVEYEDEDKNIVRYYSGRQITSTSELPDDQLDIVMAQILTTLPKLGRRLIAGRLTFLGHAVTRSRLEASYLRVHGPSHNTFSRRAIVRREYNVKGYNSLIHHDGQHGLIRWKIVVHGFIDGYSRFITGIKAHNNNRAETVYELFLKIIATHLLPIRVRGDHGGENVLVARHMEEARGQGRGSYIFGRSVHNIRIERLWVDFTNGIGSKWKTFFEDLELTADLDVEQPSHIWLIHYLFLGPLNDDIQAWANAWNHHKMHVRGLGTVSPIEIRYFDTLHHGIRGLSNASVQGQDPVLSEQEMREYGIDWEAYRNPQVQHHYHIHNMADVAREGDFNPFVAPEAHRPERFSLVEVDEARCPFTDEGLSVFATALVNNIPENIRTSPDQRKQYFILALGIARSMSSI